MAKTRYIKSNLCQVLGLSCIGCCGNRFGTKEELARGIEKNTIEFKHDVTDKTNHEHLKKFRDRHPKQSLRMCGVCRNLVYDVNQDLIFCPLHPEQAGHTKDGKDLREGHCDVMHLCKTSFLFDLWPDEKKQKFLKFVRQKKRRGMCWYEFSKKMDNDELLNEFEGI